MKRSLVCLLLSLITAGVAPALAQAAETAQVTMTVTQFRPLTSLAENRYVDATTSLSPHSTVRLVDREGMPTFICKEAVNLEITVASADPNEVYVPLAVTFQQQGDFTGEKRDRSGALNFERLTAPNGKLMFRNKALLRSPEGHYEFFVLIQRLSDGALGIIDPAIINDPT